MLEAQITEKRFGERLVLDRISLRVAAGEVVAVTGPSGCGKSTLLRCIAGLEEITSGELYIGDELVNEVPPAKRGIAMVFQEPRLLPWKTAAANIALAAPGADVEAALAAVGLGGQGSLLPRQMSLGMARRVAVARALAVQPQILLLDEAFVSLDAESHALTRAAVTEYCRVYSPAVVMVSHNPAELDGFADRVMSIP